MTFWRRLWNVLAPSYARPEARHDPQRPPVVASLVVVNAEQCDICNGTTTVRVDVPGVGHYDDDCWNCDGTGRILDEHTAIPVTKEPLMGLFSYFWAYVPVPPPTTPQEPQA